MEKLTKQHVEAHDPNEDFEKVDVKIPAWGYTVEVRGLSIGEVQEVEQLVKSGEFHQDINQNVMDIVLKCAMPFDRVEDLKKFDYRGVLELAKGILEFSGMYFLQPRDMSAAVEELEAESAADDDLRAIIDEGADDVEEQVESFLEEAKGNSATTPS